MQPNSLATRFRVGLWMALGLLLPVWGLALDTDVRVPIPLQATLLAKVARYDGKLAQRAAGTVRVLVVHRSGDARSQANAGRFKEALDGLNVLQGRAQSVEVSSLATPSALAAAVDTERIAIVVLSTGFSSTEVTAISAALTGHDVLSASLEPGSVDGGVVLGFDVADGRPTILVNLRQAQRQNVQLAAPLLALVKVVP